MLTYPTIWATWLRKAAAFGMLAYIASFFILGPSAQKTVFYLLVAAPSTILFRDYIRLFKGEIRTSTACILLFLIYFSLSALWSNEAQLVDGLKLTLSIMALHLAVNSPFGQHIDSANVIRLFILAIGSCTAAHFILSFAFTVGLDTNLSALFTHRYSLRTFNPWGDSNPINSAVYFGVVTLTAWFYFPQSNRVMKPFLVLLIGVCLVIVLLTQSRGPLIALLVTLLSISMYRQKKDDLLLWLAVLIPALAVVLYFDLSSVILHRADSPNYRLEIWANAIDQVKKNPLLGYGLNVSANIQITNTMGIVLFTVGHSHSSILETVRVGGIVGGFLFFVMIASASLFVHTRKERSESFFPFWLLFGLLCLMSNGRLPFIRPSVEWFAFWIPLFCMLMQSGKNLSSTKRTSDHVYSESVTHA